MPNGVMQINEIGRTRLVLAPFNRVQVNALLNQLPEGAQLTQEVYAILDSLEDVVNLSISGEATNTETNTAVGTLVAASQGTQDIAGLQRGRSAGTTRRQGNVLESHQERLTLDIGERDVHTAGVVVLGVTVQGGVLHGEQALGEALGETLHMLGVVLDFGIRVSILNVLEKQTAWYCPSEVYP